VITARERRIGESRFGVFQTTRQGAEDFPSDPSSPGRDPAGGQVRLLEPGLSAKNYGPMTPIELMIGHVVYGHGVYGHVVYGHVVYGLVVALVFSAANRTCPRSRQIHGARMWRQAVEPIPPPMSSRGSRGLDIGLRKVRAPPDHPKRG
jgi:hypothetical protein